MTIGFRHSLADAAQQASKYISRAALDSTQIERLERALALAAYVVLRHGSVYAMYIDRLENELKAARRNDPTERAKRILEAYAVDGGRNVMRSSHSRLSSSDGPTP